MNTNMNWHVRVHHLFTVGWYQEFVIRREESIRHPYGPLGNCFQSNVTSGIAHMIIWDR